MQSAVLEQRIVRDDETNLAEEEVYSGNRFSAAKQFARDIFVNNVEDVSEISPDYEKNRRWYDPLVMPIGEPLKYPFCYFVSINSFIYALLALKYSRQDQGYTFSDKPKNRLSIVG